MPFSDPMSWIAKERRWKKYLPGKPRKAVFFVPKKHGLPPTEEGSREGMRKWWAAQKAIMDSAINEEEKKWARMYLHRMFVNAYVGDAGIANDDTILRGLIKD